MTQLSDPWAPTPQVVADYIWYGNGGSLFQNLIYSIGGLTYPPVTDAYYAGDHLRYQAYSTPVGQTVIFDAINSLGLSTGYASPENLVPQTIVPTGVTVLSYSWDFGNGQTASGPVVSTIYETGGPDTTTTLAVLDSLGRSRTVFHNMNLQGTPQEGGSIRIGTGTYRAPGT